MKQETKLKILTALGVLLVVLLLTVFLFSGENSDLLKSLFTDNLSNEQLQERLRGFGLRGWITTAVLSMLQVICTFLPAEPVQMLAGLTFGFGEGVLCCIAGVFLGIKALRTLAVNIGFNIFSFYSLGLALFSFILFLTA
mgnify:CR=1 FL=1